MSKTVFILGAGASCKAGVPLMNNFLDEARKLYASGMIDDNDEEHFERVFRGISELQGIHSKSNLDLYNLEAVFATFEMANRLKKMPGFENEEIELIKESMKRVIVVTIEKLLKFPLSGKKPTAPQPYYRFGQLLKKMLEQKRVENEISILTFNYDVAADYMLYEIDFGPDYCLDNSMEFGSQRVIKLLKLHGSINWGVTKKKNRVRPLHFHEYFNNKNYLSEKYVSIPIGSALPKFMDIDFEKEPVIIPPTWNKSSFHEDLFTVWTQAAKELETAENLIIIGFSLPETDIFFKHLYALGTAGNVPFNRLWVVDPDQTGEVEERYRNLLGPGAISRFQYFRQTFEEACSTLESEF